MHTRLWGRCRSSGARSPRTRRRYCWPSRRWSSRPSPCRCRSAFESSSCSGGLVGVLALNLLLLRPAFRPLDELAETMRRHDPLTPGVRVPVDGEPDVAALAQAFNEMLDRMESERRYSARQALRALEGERSRIARELHDDVGQTLTGAMLQIEALAARIPDDLRDELDELRETARSGTEDV